MGVDTPAKIVDQSKLRDMLKVITDIPRYIGAAPFDNESDEDDIPIMQIANFVLKQFPTITGQKLIEAFEMAAAGKLMMSGKVVTGCAYGRGLNITLVGSVLAAYQEHQRKMAARNIHENRHITLCLSDKRDRMTPKDYLDDLIARCRKEGRPPEFHLYRLIHEELAKRGEVPEIREETVSDKRTMRVERLFGSNAVKNKHKDHVITWLKLNGHLPCDNNIGAAK